MINEVLMGPGTWELTLREDTPIDVRRSVPYWVPSGSDQLPMGHICITPTRLAIQELTRAIVVANARYSGVISQRSNKMRTFGGNGLAIWFGTQNQIGARLDNGTPHTKTWQSWVHSIFTSTSYSGALGNGLTEGSYFSPFTTPITGYASTPGTAADAFSSSTHRVTWDMFCSTVNNNWRVTAQGNFESGNPAFLFNFVPVVIVTRGVGGIETGMVGLAATELEVDENFDEYVNSVAVFGKVPSGGGSIPNAVSVASTIIKGFNGTGDGQRQITQTSDSTDSGAVGDQSSTYLDKYSRSQQQITCRVDCYDVRRYVEPGDNIWIFDPETDLVDTTLPPTNFRGRTLQPALVKVQGVNWPIDPGMGVYSIQTQDGTTHVTDLTDWVEYETSDPELIIGARALTAKEVATGIRPWFQ